MPYTARPLASFPRDFVEVACDRCPTRDLFSREVLLAKYGPEITLPDLLGELTNCEPRLKYSEPCGAHYPALSPDDPPPDGDDLPFRLASPNTRQNPDQSVAKP